MDYKCTVEMKGNLFDSLKLSALLDEIADSGCICKIKEIKIGETKTEASYIRVKIRSDSRQILDELIIKLKELGAVPVKTYSKTVEVQGHIVDSLTLSKIFDIIFLHDARYEIQDIKIGIEKKDFSYAKIKISTVDQSVLNNILEKITKQGAVLLNE